MFFQKIHKHATEKLKKIKESMEEEVDTDAQQDDIIVDDLLPDNVTKADDVTKEVEIKEWAVEVDVTQKLDDFHQKVPNMAKKVFNFV